MYVAYQQNVRLPSFVYLFLNTMSRFDPKKLRDGTDIPGETAPPRLTNMRAAGAVN